VTLRGLSAAYPLSNGDGPVLSGVDLDLAPGERLAVVGASGSGKSTLLHVLAGLLRPSAGAAEIDGCDVSSGAGRAAYMFQDDLLLPWKTVLGNAVFAAAVARGAGAEGEGGGDPACARRAARSVRATRAAREAAARGILEEFGLGDVVDDLPGRLSGGMRQRVALARTLMLGRGLILLDEPFGSLDMLTRAEMQRWLLDVMEAHPATWVLVTHDVREAALLCDRVVVLGGLPAWLQHATRVELSTAERRDLAAAGLHAPAAGLQPHPGAPPSASSSAAPAVTLERTVAELHAYLSAAVAPTVPV
jgi:putative hydroxymethylpyrimidine transport system ATP-binding protein